MADTITAAAMHAADTDFLVRQAMNTGYQWASVIAPPAYIGFVLARRGRGGLSLNGVLRATWIASLGTAGAAGGLSYARYAYSTEQVVRRKRIETLYNTNILRQNDHSTIGGVVMAVLVPAVLWNRANAFNLILGGGSIGSAIGVLAHWGRTVAGDPPLKLKVPPAILEGQLPSSGGKA